MSGLLEDLRSALQDRYSVDREVGRGGMATVFLAEDLKHGRRVAIKVLSPELSSSIDGDRFKREIQIAARLSHPHILPIFDSGDAGGLLYYTMPFVEGESLRKRIQREIQLSIEDALSLTSEVADALSYAHSLGVVHRDIKPENVLLHGGHAVVADFGIARVIQDSGGDKLTQTGMSIGTAAYMSPEQFSGEHVDGRADLYSLACMLYEMLVGQVPFTGPNAMAIMARHTMEAAPSIRIVRATVPDDLEDTIMRALEKVPADRFPTVSQFKEALLGGSTTTTAIRRVTRRTTTSRVAIAEQEDLLRRRRPLKIAAIVAAGVVVVAAALGLYGLRGRSHTAASAGAIDARELAVLYLDDDSKDSSLRHVADGLTESLISQLGRVEGLHVVSPGGVAPYRNTTVPDDSVGRALKVGVLVKGSIVQQGSAYKVSLKLVDGQGGGDIDRRSFTVAQKDLLTARDSVARVTADLLRGPLGSEVRLRELRGATKSIDAWTLVQRVENAKKDADRLTAASDPDGALKRLSEADSLAARAAALDDKWPEPLVQRGAIAYQLARLTKDPNTLAAFVQAGLGHAGRALELDPRSADALELRGSLKYYRISRGLVSGRAESTTLIDEAEKDLRDAVAIAPNQATAWNALSVLQYAKQNVVDSHAYAQKAYEADAYLRSASDILWRLYATSYDLEQFPDAMKWCAEGQRRFPVSSRFIWCQLYLMLSKAVPADPDEAWTLAGQIEKLTPKQDLDLERRQAHMLVAIVLGRAKLVDSAHKVILRTRAGADVDPRGEVMGLEALARTFLGERDAAITLLEQYLTSHPDHRAGFAKVNAWWWRDLQQEPRFKTLAGAGR